MGVNTLVGCWEGKVGWGSCIGPPLLLAVGDLGWGEPGERAGVSLLLSCHTLDTCSSVIKQIL